MSGILRTAVLCFILCLGLVDHAVAQDPYPALFDDFEYTSTDVVVEDTAGQNRSSRGSLFGSNDWLTTSGIDSMRAWRRYNWTDLKLSCTDCGFKAMERGRIRLFINEGGKSGGGDHDQIPTIKSGFVTGRGTYAARLRMHHPPSEGNFIQAFWTSATDVIAIDQGDTWLAYMSETDIESYSRSYTGRGTTDLSVANFLGKLATRGDDNSLTFYKMIANHDHRVRNGGIRCIENPGSSTARMVNCRNVLFDRDWIMSIRIEPRAYVDYELRSADGRYAAGSVRRVGRELRVRPMRVSEYPPSRDVIAIFGLYSDRRETRLVDDLVLDVDWYYHAREILSHEEVLEQVQYWKSLHPRVNTLDVPFQDVTSRSDFQVSIDGPAVLPQNRVGSWRLGLTPLNTTYIVERFEYAYLECPNDKPVITGDFIPIREPELVARIPSRYDGMTMRAVVLNRWSGQVRSAAHTVWTDQECEALHSW